jgi:Flp pilus assembly protein CpaB
MKRKPLFITLIVAAAVIGIVAVILFMKDAPPVTKKAKVIAEPEPAEPAEPETDETHGE